MILDITALKDYKNIKTLQQLSLSLDVDKVVLLLDASPETSDPEYLSDLISMGIYNFTKEHESLIKKQLDRRIISSDNLEELFQLRNRFFAGCNNLYPEGIETPIMDDIKQFVLETVENILRKFSDDMQTALRNLTNETVDNLINIDNMSYPDGSSSYRVRAIFSNENPEQLFNSLCNLSNKGRNAFSLFLCHHYNLDHIMTGFGDTYKLDLPCLLVLQKMIYDKYSTVTGVDKLSFIKLNEVLIKAICRCRGESNVQSVTSL